MAQEGFIEVTGGRVWYRSLGEGGIPLLCLHGGPGFTHYYLEPLEALADERQVIFYDQLGCGKSDRPEDVTLWTVERFIDELVTVRETLGLDRLHLFGSSWGGMLAQQYVLDVTSGAVSLTISNSIASIPQFSDMVARLKSDLDPATQAAIDRHEAAGTTYSAEYQAAIRTWNETYLCRVRPWPTELEEAFCNMGTQIFETMFGPSDFHIVGTIRGWDVFDRLTEIALPTLVLAGRFDECVPEHMWAMHQRIAGSRFELFESSAHMPFIEEPHRFDQVMRDFLRHRDGI